MMKKAIPVLVISGALLALGACSRETGQRADQAARSTGQFAESAGNDALANTDDAADQFGNEVGGDIGQGVANVIETDTDVQDPSEEGAQRVQAREASLQADQAAVRAEAEAARLENAARDARTRARRARADARRLHQAPR